TSTSCLSAPHRAGRNLVEGRRRRCRRSLRSSRGCFQLAVPLSGEAAEAPLAVVEGAAGGDRYWARPPQRAAPGPPPAMVRRFRRRVLVLLRLRAGVVRCRL